MKKILLVLAMLLIATTAHAETLMVESGVNMDNFWQKNGKEAEKVLTVTRNIIHTNNLKRASISVDRN